MTAPIGQRIKCVLVGHDWRKAISPRDGFYVRCRRCWCAKAECTSTGVTDDVPTAAQAATPVHAAH